MRTACGLFPRRAETLGPMQQLPAAPLLGQPEVLGFIERHALAAGAWASSTST